MAQCDPKDKTFLITGGASGIGAEYVKTFLALGAKFVAVLDIAEQQGKALVESLTKIHGNKAVFIKCDVSKEDDITRAFDAVLAQFKQIDVIINNALHGLVSFTLEGVKHMRKDEGGAGGTIVNIASTAALSKTPFVPIYCGSKIAVLHFTQCLAMDPFFENTGIRVLTMCFGPTDTPLLQNLETRAYHPKLGQFMATTVTAENNFLFQKVESAVAAFVEILKKGSPGSIWLSLDNKPVQNITPVIDRVFEDFKDAMGR